MGSDAVQIPISQYRLTRPEQEALFLQREALREQLILSAVPWGYKLALRYHLAYPDRDLEELQSLSMFGVIEGVDQWKPELGALTTIIAFKVRRHFQKAIGEDRIIRVPRVQKNQSERLSSLREAAKNITCLDPGAYKELQGDSEGNVETRWTIEHREKLEDSMFALNKNERSAIRGALAGEFLRETGKRIGVTKERVRQIRNKAIEKLQAVIKTSG